MVRDEGKPGSPGSRADGQKTPEPKSASTEPTRKDSSPTIQADIGALVVNLCKSNLRLAANLSSGVRGRRVQVLANALAEHERVAHRPTETHNVKMSLPQSNQEAV